MRKTVSSLVMILALTVASLVPMRVSAEDNSYTFRLALHFDRAPYPNMVCRYSRALGDDRYEIRLNALDGSVVASAPMSEIASESTSGLTRHYVWELSLAYGYRLGAKIRDTHTGNWWPIAQATNSGRELVWPNADGDSYATGCVGLIDASPAPTATPSPTATSTITPEPPLPQPPTVTPTPTSTPVMAPAAPVHRIRLPLVYNCPANPAFGSPCAP